MTVSLDQLLTQVRDASTRVVSAVAARPMSDGDRIDSAVMARTLGRIFLSGAALAQVWVLLPHADGANLPELQLVIVVAAVVGVVLTVGVGDTWPRPAFHAVLLLALAVVSAGHVFAGPHRTGFSFFYLWATPWAFVFFGRRRRGAAHPRRWPAPPERCCC